MSTHAIRVIAVSRLLSMLLLFVVIMSGLYATPLTEGFEGYTFPPTGWTVINGGDANTWQRNTNTDIAHTGTAAASITYSPTVAHNDWLITPQFSPTVGDATCSFWAKNVSPGYIDFFNVKLSNSNNTEASFTVTLASNIGPEGTYTLYTYDLTAYIGQNVYLGIQAISTNMLRLAVDDFTYPVPGIGTEYNPIQITTAAELNNIRNYLGSTYAGKYFKLMNDIDLTAYLAPGGAGYTAWGTAGWLPIGSNASRFCGHFDGNYKTISGLKIDRPANTDIGFFGNVNVGAVISNTRLATAAGSYVKGWQTTGMLVGYNDGTLTNCSATGSVRGQSDGCGVLIGAVGGSGSLYRCFSSGDVIGAGYRVGGLVGHNYGIINNCYSRASVTGQHYLGGLVGYQGSGTITNSYATGLITGSSYGGLLGNLIGGSVVNSYWDIQTTGLAFSNGSDASYGKSTVQMRMQTTYTGWDFAGETANGYSDYWSIASADNSGYPFLCWDKINTYRHPLLNSPADLATGILQSGFNLTWTAFPGGQVPTSYNLYMIQGSPVHIFETGYSGQHTFTNLTGTSYNPVTAGGILFDYSQTWYWAVTACFAGVELTPYPDVRSYTIESDVVFAEGFETGNTQNSSTIANWSQELVYSSYWTANSTDSAFNKAPRTGSFNVTLSNQGSCWMFHPASLIAGQPYKFELYARQSNANTTYANIGLYYGTAGTVAAMTNTVVPQTGLGNGGYQLVTGTFVPSSTRTYYLGIHGYTNSNSILSMDDVTLRHTPIAPPEPVTQVLPANLATNQTTLPTLTWTTVVTGGYASGFKVYCQASTIPITPTTLIATDTASPYTLTTALEYNTTYYWMIVATNAYGDATGSTVRSFTTAAQLSEVFTVYPPANWTRYSGELDWVTTLTANTDLWVQDDWCNVTAPVNKSAKMRVYGTNRFAWLVTPPIQMTGAGTTLELDIALTDLDNSNAITSDPTGTTGVDDRFIILIGDGSSWSPANICREWNNTSSANVYNSIPSAGLHISIPLDSYTGTKYVAFYASSNVANADNDLFVDNVLITSPPQATNDLAARWITGPDFASGGASVTHTITISNDGTASQTGYIVYLKCLSPALTLGSYVMPALASGVSTTHDFTWTPAEVTTGNITIYGEVALAGDAVTGNNLTANFPFSHMSGTGTAPDPYQITSPATLNLVRIYLGSAYADKHFKLMNDIDLTSYLASGGAGYTAWGTAGWLPFGTSSNSFWGHFDGNNQTISGLYINLPGAGECAFWAATNATAIIENLNIETAAGSMVSGWDTSAIMVGHNDGTINNCSARGSIRGHLYCGVLVGRNDGIINRCLSIGDITATASITGGLIGLNFGSVTDSYSRASVTGITYLGGLVGYQYSGSVTGCYAAGSLTASGAKSGLIANLVGGSVINSYWDTQTTGVSTSSGSDVSFGKTTLQMQTQSTFAGWDFSTVWNISSLVNGGYPQLVWAFVLPAPDSPTNLVISTGVPANTFTLNWDDMSAAWYGIYGGTTPENLTYLGWTNSHSITLSGGNPGFYKVTSGRGTANGSQLLSRESLPNMLIPTYPRKGNNKLRSGSNRK